MLGKLLKYEFKASYKLMFIAHAFILLISLLIGGSLLFQSNRAGGFDNWSLTNYGILSIYIVLFYIALVAISVFGTQIYVAVRFYKNFFTDEGYLMFTLPTSPTQLLHSKIITGLAWSLFNVVIVVISAAIIYIPFITKVLVIGDTIQNILSTVEPAYVFTYIGVTILGLIATLLQVYGCICIGQLFHKNRLLAAIITYLGTNFCMQIVSVVTLLVTNTSSTFLYSVNTTAGSFSSTSDLGSLIPSIVVSLLTIGIFYGTSHYIMNKKLNLV